MPSTGVPKKGSSPLTRGKRQGTRIQDNVHGLIPAHAGKTRLRDLDVRRRRAHPRSRGENPVGMEGWPVATGSSPLTRGKPWRQPWDRQHRGLIPAHAGKTLRRRTALPSQRGSSPLTRGKRGGLDTSHAKEAAHPRSRGENSEVIDRLLAHSGSSPLTRGKPASAWRIIHAERLIPAHAGKTCEERAARPSRRAHPRSRGENIGRSSVRRAPRGSSPLTRGKRGSSHQPGHGNGLIPAHAGKTRGGRDHVGLCAAHPRSRGENQEDFVPHHEVRGSSPLTRGKRGGWRACPR